MSSQSDVLQAGIAALKQKRYADAVQALEAFCNRHDASPRDLIQAQMWLVKAYQENGRSPAAIALCRQMANSNTPEVHAWAERILPVLLARTEQTPEQLAPKSPPFPQPETSETAPPDATPSNPGPSESASGYGAAAATPPQNLSPEEAAQLLKTGNQALKTRRFAEAVAALEAYCQGTDPQAKDYRQAQMWLAKAYQGNDQQAAAIALCQELLTSNQEYVQIWAKQFLQTLDAGAKSPLATEPGAAAAEISSAAATPPAIPKAGRSQRRGVKLVMKGVATSLSLAAGVTFSLLFGMILVLCLSLMLIAGAEDPTQGLIVSVFITVLFNALVFFISPWVMDLIQGWLYGTRWTALSEIDRYSPEAGRVIRDVCRQKKLQEPRLGIIEDDNPTAFTYGSLPNSARLVVSRGLFRYLDDDEIATVYAHELGHIVHWDFAVMTLAQTLVQITYLIYVYARELVNRLGNGEIEKKIKDSARAATWLAYAFYVIGEYLLLYLSRTREYYADHFAAEVTGNPNALSRALVKIAYGILEEGKRNPEPSKVIQGTRALGICDPKSAAFTGTAYRVASEPQKVGRVFLWDMFNPWGWWMELSSTHPLTGKRVRALSTYAEQLGLDTEFDMARVVREGRKLNKTRLYGTFVMDLILLRAELLGLVIGFLLGLAFVVISKNFRLLFSLTLVGFGLGTLIKMLIMYPDFNRAPATDVLTLMSDPYASPLRGRPVKLSGEVIGRGNPGYRFSSDLQFQDPTGMIFLRYASRFGPLGNFLFGMSQADSFLHQEVAVVGWFRRGIMPWVDLIRMDCDRKWTVNSYHRFWLLVLGIGSVVLGFALPSLL